MRIRKLLISACALFLLATSASAQTRRLWVLRNSGEMIEYDATTFAAKQTVKVPAEAMQSPQNLMANRSGQILFVPSASLPLTESDLEAEHKIWFWNGHAASTIDMGLKREVGATGSNQAVNEVAPTVALSRDGEHLFWFANSAHRLQRGEVDLSTATTWLAWQTDLTGGAREEIASEKLPDCRCPTGSCEESCPYGVAWMPDEGVGKYFLVTQVVTGKDSPSYKSSARYEQEAGKWVPTILGEPLRRVLDAASPGDVIVEAIPDTGCCGWANQSNDQTVVRLTGKKQVIFDEQATYKNSDYDVSFFTANAKLSPDLANVAMTINATAKANQAIQLSEQGQANPEESKLIRKALADLPAVEVKTLDDAPKRIAFVPHASLVGWINDKEMLLIEDHLLVAYNVATGARRKSTIRADDVAKVFLR